MWLLKPSEQFIIYKSLQEQDTSLRYDDSAFFLADLAFRPCELLSSLFVRRLSSVVRPSTFHILIFSSETTGPIATKLWLNGPWMAPLQNCVR